MTLGVLNMVEYLLMERRELREEDEISALNRIHQQNPSAPEDKQSPEPPENLQLHLQALEMSGNSSISRGLLRMLGFF
jgi:hypothetical protein